MGIFSSMKGAILFLAAVAVAGILLGFIKGAIETRRAGKPAREEAMRKREEERARIEQLEKEQAVKEKLRQEKIEKKRKKKQEQQKPKPKRLGESGEKNEPEEG